MQLAKFFVHKVNPETSVLITDAGNWAALSAQELKAVQETRFDAGLRKKLEAKKVLLTARNKKALLHDYQNLFSHLNEGISLHIINPSMRCNLGCPYCYAEAVSMGGRGSDMSIETARKTVDFIWQTPRKNFVIEFQGGEPLANFPTIEFIVNYARKKRPKKKVHWRLVSNFSLLDGTIASWLGKNKVTDLCTSLDGPQKVHDKNRSNSYKKVVYWLDALRNDFGFGRIGALCTITRHSLPFASEIVQEYLSRGMHDITPVPVRKIGRAKENWGSIGHTAAQYTQFWKQVMECCIAETRQGRPITEQFSLMIARKLLNREPAFHACFSKPCGAALMQASYQPDGSIFTCDEGKAEQLFRLGSVGQTYRDVFTSPNALNMIALSSSLGMLCNECKWSPFCSFCPVMAFSSQGSPIPLLYDNADCSIRKAQFSHVFEKLFSKDRPVLKQWLDSSKDL